MGGAQDQPWTVRRLLEAGAAYLSRHGIDAREARTLAEILVSEALGLRGGPGLALRAEAVPEEAARAWLRMAFRRVAGGEPAQYVLGRWPFHAIELKTDSRALIPRPETEELVERVLRHPVWASARHVADVGTGTGAIVLALAAAARRRGGTMPRFTAIDRSPEALALARENAEALGLAKAVRFVEGDACAPLETRSADVIVSNPPYIASEEVDGLPRHILGHEPRLALDGGPDGLDVVRRIVAGATQVLRPGGRLFLEIGDEQGLSLKRLLERAGYGEVIVAKDFAGHDRYAEGSLL